MYFIIRKFHSSNNNISNVFLSFGGQFLYKFSVLSKMRIKKLLWRWCGWNGHSFLIITLKIKKTIIAVDNNNMFERGTTFDYFPTIFSFFLSLSRYFFLGRSLFLCIKIPFLIAVDRRDFCTFLCL